MVKKDDFTTQAKEKFDALQKEIDELEGQLKAKKEEIKPIKAYLVAAGLVEKKARKTRKKKDEGQDEEKGDRVRNG